MVEPYSHSHYQYFESGSSISLFLYSIELEADEAREMLDLSTSAPLQLKKVKENIEILVRQCQAARQPLLQRGINP